MDSIALGQKIHKLREEKGMTQMQLAELIHMSDRTISRIEIGIIPHFVICCNDEMLYIVLKATDFSAAFLFAYCVSNSVFTFFPSPPSLP